MNSIKNILEERKQQLTDRDTVNSNKDINITVNRIPDKEEFWELENKTDDLLIELSKKPEYLANRLAQELDDLHSERWYLLLAKNTNPQILLEALSCTLDASRTNRLKTKKAHYFRGILVNKSIQIIFKKTYN